MNDRKLLRVLLPLLAALAIGMTWFTIEKPHRDVGEEAARYKMVPEELQGVLSRGDSISKGYLNAVVELLGVVEEDDGSRVVLSGGVIAAWDTIREHRRLEKGESIRLKGRVTGYDDLFGEVRMDGLVIVGDTP